MKDKKYNHSFARRLTRWVMLVLLIIFMVTATVITPGSINIPRAGQTSRAPDERIDVLIDDAGHISLAGELQLHDISEEHNLASERRNIVRRLSRRLGRELRKMNAQRPVMKTTGQPCPWPDE